MKRKLVVMIDQQAPSASRHCGRCDQAAVDNANRNKRRNGFPQKIERDNGKQGVKHTIEQIGPHPARARRRSERTEVL